MEGNSIKKISSLFIIFIASYSFIFSQTEEALNILEANKASVISIVTYGANREIMSRGSGFIVQNGILVTSYQLVSQAASAEGRDYRGKGLKVEGIMATDKNLNFAFLRIKGDNPPLTLGSSDTLDKGTKIFAMGSNEIGSIVVSEGNITDIVGLSENQRVFSTSLSIPLAFSGGPLFNAGGEAVGVIIFFDRGLNFILPTDYIRNVRLGNAVKLEDWAHEDYLATLQGNILAGTIAAAMDENSYAQRYLEQVVTLTPENADFHSLLASVYHKLKIYPNALASYQKVIELDENRSDDHFGLGLVYLEMQRYSDSITPFERAIQLNPDNKQAHYFLGNAYEKLRDFARAADAYERYLNSNPEDTRRGYIHLGLCRKELGQFDNAIATLEEAVRMKPQDEEANDLLAQTYQEAGQYDKAEEIYKFLAKLKPSDTINYYKKMLMMYDKAGLSDKAIETARTIIEMNPQSEVDIYNLGIMFMKLERYNESIEQFNNALSINPNYTYAYYNIGFCYSKQRNYDDAVGAFTRFVELAPDNADGWYSLGINYMLLRNYEASVQPLQKAIELRPDHGESYYYLATCYLNLDDRTNAEEIHRRLVEIDAELARRLERLLER